VCWIQQKITQNISCIWNIFITQKLIYAILKLTDNQIIRRLLLNKVRGKNLYLGILINLLLVTNKWLETIEAPKNEKLSIRLKHKWYCRNVKPLKNNGLLQGVQPNYDGIIITILKYTRFIRWHFWVKWTVLKSLKIALNNDGVSIRFKYSCQYSKKMTQTHSCKLILADAILLTTA